MDVTSRKIRAQLSADMQFARSPVRIGLSNQESSVENKGSKVDVVHVHERLGDLVPCAQLENPCPPTAGNDLVWSLSQARLTLLAWATPFLT